MHFIIHCLDREGVASERTAHFQAHQAHLKKPGPVAIVISGPLLADDGETPIGSAFLVTAESKAEVVEFNRRDPFTIRSVWGDVQIHPFLKRIDNR